MEINCFETLSNSNQSKWNPHIWPPFTQIASANPPNKIKVAKGALLLPEDGPAIIDAISSWWVTLHGHSEPYIANEISKQAKQLEQVIFADFLHPQAERLSQRLSKLTGLQRLFFSDNGSTAVEVALKIACQLWHNKEEPRYQIIAFEGAYHGDTFGAMALGERNLFNAPFEKMLFPVSRLPWPATWWDDEDVEDKEKVVLSNLDKLLETPTAAVIFEPLVQGAGGMAMVRPSFLKKVEKRIRQAKALLITDEVLTGFGRCGSLFAYQQADLKPDLISLSKGLTAGFLPMGITMASENIFQAFVGKDPSITFWHGHSFTANPLGCAAANASLDLLEKKPEAYEGFESRHSPHLTNLSKESKVIRPRLKGSIAAFNLKVDGPKGYLNEAGKVLKEFALNEGVFIRPLGDVVYLLPPLCIKDSELEKCYLTIQKGLKTLF
tara:strand:+ start:10829 stop:12142 length:1314 start_codon:yes stop_codon:yes gene_type:complete